MLNIKIWFVRFYYSYCLILGYSYYFGKSNKGIITISWHKKSISNWFGDVMSSVLFKFFFKSFNFIIEDLNFWFFVNVSVSTSFLSLLQESKLTINCFKIFIWYFIPFLQRRIPSWVIVDFENRDSHWLNRFMTFINVMKNLKNIWLLFFIYYNSSI